jgi:hypothetical protein
LGKSIPDVAAVLAAVAVVDQIRKDKDHEYF